MREGHCGYAIGSPSPSLLSLLLEILVIPPEVTLITGCREVSGILAAVVKQIVEKLQKGERRGQTGGNMTHNADGSILIGDNIIVRRSRLPGVLSQPMTKTRLSSKSNM